MKKSTKKQLLIATISVAVGLAIIIITSLVFGMNEFKDISVGIIGGADGPTEVYVTDSLLFAENDIKNIEIDIDVSELRITTGDEIGFSATNSNKSQLICELDTDGTLKIYDKRQRKWFAFGGFSDLNDDIPVGILTLPKTFALHKLDIDCDVGFVKIEDISLDVRELDVDVDVGTVELSNIKSSKSDIDVDVGDITIEGELLGKNDFDCSIGSITVKSKGNISDYSFNTKASVGTITVNGKSTSGLAQHSSEVKKENHFDLNCDIGDIIVTIGE